MHPLYLSAFPNPCTLSGFRNGVDKIRGIDHMTESMVNGSTTPQEKLSVEGLDLWMELARSIKLSTKVCVRHGH